MKQMVPNPFLQDFLQPLPLQFPCELFHEYTYNNILVPLNVASPIYTLQRTPHFEIPCDTPAF